MKGLTISNDALLIAIERERRRRKSEQEQPKRSLWTAYGGIYVNRDSGKAYTPHHADEQKAVLDDSPRRVLFKGGEGSGKSVAGIVKGLERLRRGMNGILGSPDFEHFKKSLWPEFARWCPWGSVIPEQQYRSRPGWEPQRPFSLTFITPDNRSATVMCGGFDDPGSWEGPNVHWAHGDEMRRHKTPAMLKVLEGRCRLKGPNGEPPQWWYTTTPRKHWLYAYFGPWEKDGVDPFAAFKKEIRVIDLYTIDNERMGNLYEGYTQQRAQGLTESEARVLLDAAWEDESDVDRYLPNMLLWDACKEIIPPLTRYDPMIIALDAATGRDSSASDCFGLVGVTRHPSRSNDVMVRIVHYWQAKAGKEIHFMGTPDAPGPERTVIDLYNSHNVMQVCYDPHQLVSVGQRLIDLGIWAAEFSQAGERLESDRLLLDVIAQRRISHDGNADLRQHIANADRKIDAESRKLRIVKRSEGLKVDLAVALSMATKRCLDLNL